MNNLDEIIKTRQSCRKYDTKPVEKEKLEKLAEAVRLAPSACNSQPYKFIIVSGEKSQNVRDAVQKLGRNKFTNECPSFAIIVEQKASLVPAIAKVVKSQEFAPIDIGIAATHYCLTATDLGLSTCMIGWLDEDKLRKDFSIPKERRIRLVIATGYAAQDDTLREKKRKELSDIAEFID